MQRNVSIVSALLCIFLSFQLSCITCYYLELCHFTATSALVYFFFLMFVEQTGKCNCAFCVISSVNGVAAALSAGLVHGRSPEFAAGTSHCAFLGGSHVP